MKKRTISLFLCLFMIAGTLCSPRVYADNLFEYSDGGGLIHIPKKGWDLTEYDPQKDGYYGYIHVQYQPGGVENSEVRATQTYMPVIVVDNHILARAEDVSKVTNTRLQREQSRASFSLFNRTLHLSANDKEGFYIICDEETHTDPFFEYAYDLSETPVFYEGTLWVPLQDICIIMDIGTAAPMGQDGTDQILSFLTPQKNVFDVFSRLNGWNAGKYMTQETDENFAANSIDSRSFLLLNNLTKWDYIWYNACLNMEIFDDSARLSENQWDRIMSENALHRLIVPNPSEATEAAQNVKDTLITVASAVTDNKITDQEWEVVDWTMRLRNVESWNATSANTKAFAVKARKIAECKTNVDAASDKIKSLNKANSIYTASSVVISGGLSFMYYKSLFDNADDMILNSMEDMTAMSSHAHLSDAAIERLRKRVNSIRSNLTGHAFGKSLVDTITSEGPDLVLGALSAKAALVSGLLKAALNLNPFYQEIADQEEDYSVYQFTLLMQDETNDFLQQKLQAVSQYSGNRESRIQEAMEAGYLFLKVCNLARESAVGSGLVSEEEVEERQTLISEDLAALTAEYKSNPVSEADKRLDLVKGQSELIRTFVIPMEAAIQGEVRDELQEELAPESHGEIQIGGETFGTFEIPDGEYKINIVLDYPTGMKDEVSRNVEMEGIFSSDKVEGRDIIQESVNGGAGHLMTTAYLGGIKVSGEVRDKETNQRLSNVTVSCHTERGTFKTLTDKQGRFVFEGVKKGYTSLEYKKEKYKPYANAIEISSQKEVKLETVYLEPGNFGNFYGYAYAQGAEGEPNTIAKDTRLFLYDENRELKYEYDQSGGDQFTLTVEPGTYIVRCISSLGEAIVEYTVPKDEVVEANIRLGDPAKVRYDYIVSSLLARGNWYEGVLGELSASVMSIGASLEFEYGLDVTGYDPSDPMNVTAEGSGYFGQGGIQIGYDVTYDGSQSVYTYSAFGFAMDEQTVDTDPGLCHLEQVTDSMLDSAEILDDYSFSIELDQAQIQALKINPMTISQDLTDMGLTEGTLYVNMTQDLMIDVITLEAVGKGDYEGVYGQVDLVINFGFSDEAFEWER